MQVRVKENTEEFGTCGCGRSPTGKCIGWHGLNETELNAARAQWQEDQNQQELDEYNTINEVSKLIAEETLDDWESNKND
jgi:hypothetical protein